MKYHFASVRLNKLGKLDNSKGWWRFGTEETYFPVGGIPGKKKKRTSEETSFIPVLSPCMTLEIPFNLSFFPSIKCWQ